MWNAVCSLVRPQNSSLCARSLTVVSVAVWPWVVPTTSVGLELQHDPSLNMDPNVSEFVGTELVTQNMMQGCESEC